MNGLFCVLPIVLDAQSSSGSDIGNTTFYNSDGRSGTRQSIGDTDFYNFSDGTTTFDTWQDGTTSTHLLRLCNQTSVSLVQCRSIRVFHELNQKRYWIQLDTFFQ